MGNVYYVGVNGTDSAAGTQADPMSVTRAVSLVQPGDTVRFLAGTYRNATYGNGDIWKDSADTVLKLNDLHGTAEAPITFMAAPGQAVKLQYDGNGAIVARGSSHVRIEGFEIEGSGSIVSLDDALAAQWLYRVNVGTQAKPVYEVRAIDPAQPYDLSGLNASRPFLFNSAAISLPNGSHHITITGNTIHDATAHAVSAHGGNDYIIVTGNEIYDNVRYTSVGGHAISFKDLDSGADAASTDTSNAVRIVVTGNHLHDNNNLLVSWSPAKTEVHIGIDEGKSIHIQDSTADKKWDHGSILVANNLIERAGNAAITTNNADRVLVVNNTIVDAGYLNRIIAAGDADPLAPDFRVNAAIRLAGGKDNVVANNLVALSDSVVYAVDADPSVTSANTTIAGNMVSGGAGFNFRADATALSAGFVTVSTIGFVDPAAGDYRLRPGSVAINAGTTSPKDPNTGAALVTADITGAARVDGYLDVGAYELLGTTLNGDVGDDALSGTEAGDTLIGGRGNDTLRGGAGDDTYLFNLGDGQDIIVAEVDVRSDRLETIRLGSGILPANVLARLANDTSLELIIVGTTDRITIEGFYVSHDTANASNPVQQVVFASGEAWDRARMLSQTALTFSLVPGKDKVNDVLTGNSGADLITGLSGNDKLTGNAGDDTLDGGTGADTMVGGLGDDVYVVDASNDVVTELAAQGTDTVQSYRTYVLGSHVENLTLLEGVQALNATGNTLANVLVGNSLANRLSGDTGADTMSGGAGNDTYVVDNVGDVVQESAGEGTDTVESSVTFTLSAHVESLKLTGSAAIHGAGNALNNTLTGNSGANVLDGGAGADAMSGGSGNDIYVVDDAGDSVTELAGAGTDTVRSAVDHTLAANVERLELLGSARIGTGNTLANELVGTSRADQLFGLAGNDILRDLDDINGNGPDTDVDTLVGGTGNDSYHVHVGDIVTEALNEGSDSVFAWDSFTLSDNVEALTLLASARAVSATGNALANTLTGNDVDNILDGRLGADKMAGGKGNDTYYVDNSADSVTELAGAGTDAVVSSLASYTLSANVETLMLAQGSAALKGVGSAGANTIIGNSAGNTLDGASGNDTLIGGGGADTLTGGLGSDTFYFGTSADAVDTIKDFAKGIDKLVFLDDAVPGRSVGGIAASQLVAGRVANAAGAQFLYDASTGALWFDADGTGAQAAWQVASLSSKPSSIAYTDFSVVADPY